MAALTMMGLQMMVAALPPKPDDVRIHVHPQDYRERAGPLAEFSPKPVSGSLFSKIGIPVYEDLKVERGTLVLHNSTRKTVEVIPFD